MSLISPTLTGRFFTTITIWEVFKDQVAELHKITVGASLAAQ